ncbi:UNKNOWN [Stylonychia lemnae]|uniref:Uncharacterized protein n=1 Tax=Stylonychia lemnae TaxID=5949 RepID=A0A078AS35_STYLE|nr:UNKNOWN [Stylonychia lemnae]|eukprot:CDW83698.1 UNKNOWN [Stylonychia lemnae]
MLQCKQQKPWIRMKCKIVTMQVEFDLNAEQDFRNRYDYAYEIKDLASRPNIESNEEIIFVISSTIDWQNE